MIAASEPAIDWFNAEAVMPLKTRSSDELCRGEAGALRAINV
jgi:hypothetical protein